MATNSAEIRHLTRPEGRLAYTVTGTGPLVIAVPGMGDLRSVYRDLEGPLVEAGYRLAVMDLRGHGDSDTTFRTHGDAATGADILALAEELGERAIVIGNSMSASAAAWAAAERPDAVAGLVLVSPLLREPISNRLAQAAMRLVYRVMFARPWGAAFWGSYYAGLNKVTKAPWLDEHVRAIRSSLGEPGRLRSLRHLAVQLDHSEVEVRLPEVATPALVLIGDHDPDFRSPADELIWATAAISGEGALIEDAGHYAQAQRPDLVARAALSFLSKVRPTTQNPAPQLAGGPLA
ncbi:alpha/beta fold hydrolase [Occultella aeris]|uniref:2-hydroxy-6-oxo-6-phenylhexa-2,4-dienoate hydrolase n=1 Tax=Occultella aeris TaxID=2761496 RepID=A0A7M4DGC1_9MICO|nr:alpha/beta hydrolase [Occultella aeris]VZO35964.1 2-hydroxy-6-oxo-6-phenylhexa-2,4-dienoate hydrolase [Occultella aeris]